MIVNQHTRQLGFFSFSSRYEFGIHRPSHNECSHTPKSKSVRSIVPSDINVTKCFVMLITILFCWWMVFGIINLLAGHSSSFLLISNSYNHHHYLHHQQRSPHHTGCGVLAQLINGLPSPTCLFFVPMPLWMTFKYSRWHYQPIFPISASSSLTKRTYGHKSPVPYDQWS